MKIELELTPEEAEELMFAAKLRAVQRNAPQGTVERMTGIRKQIEEQMVASGVWSGPVKRFPIDNDIRVNVVARNRW